MVHWFRIRRLHILVSAVALTGVPTLAHSQELPIKPTRTIAFTTEEGSYMDVDVSPDGKTILFDLLGDLYTVPSTGGEATQLTRGLAVNRRPVWSPDGKEIAYVSDASGALQLTVRNISGTFQRVLEPSKALVPPGEDVPELLWTRDGEYVFVDGGYTPGVFGLAGGQIPFDDQGMSHPIQFSADGRFAYDLDSGRIRRYDRTERTRTVISPVLRTFQRAALSPNGQWWAYVVDTNAQKSLVLRDLSTNAERVLVPSLSVTYPYSRTYHQPRFAFTADSKSLVISYGGKIHWIDAASGNDRIIPFRAHVRVDCGPLDYSRFRLSYDSLHVRYTRDATASPDGQHLVFTALGKVYVSDLPDGKAHVLAPQPLSQFNPEYSPDGEWIVYASWSDTARGAVWRVPARGGTPQQVIADTGGVYVAPAWSPDGKRLAVISGKIDPKDPYEAARSLVGNGKLELVTIGDTNTQVVDDSVPLENHLQFSLDGSHIIYRPPRLEGGAQPFIPQLVTSDLSGHAKRPIVLVDPTRVDPFEVQHQVLSPDGRFLAFSMKENLYLVPLCDMVEPPVLFGQTQTLSVIRIGHGLDPSWEDGGKRLSWSYGNRFFRVDPEHVLAAQRQSARVVPDPGYSAINTSADQVVPLHVSVPRAYGHGTIALEDVRILTMHGDQVIEHGTADSTGQRNALAKIAAGV